MPPSSPRSILLKQHGNLTYALCLASQNRLQQTAKLYSSSRVFVRPIHKTLHNLFHSHRIIDSLELSSAVSKSQLLAAA